MEYELSNYSLFKLNFMVSQPKKIKFTKKKNNIYIFFYIHIEARIMTTGLNVALTLLHQYLKRNPAIQLYLSTYWQTKKHFKVSITVFDYFFSKSTGNIDMKIGIDSHTCTRSS